MLGAICAGIVAGLLYVVNVGLKSLLRGLVVAAAGFLFWWMLIGLLGRVVGSGLGEGRGSGAGAASGTSKTAVRPTDEQKPLLSNVPMASTSGETAHPGGVGRLDFNSADVVILFVPSPANPKVAQDFACDLLYAKSDNQNALVEIRGRNMVEFISQLGRELRKLRGSITSAS